ncbi:MAG: hypothetical protein ABIO80_10075 [Sphingomicrobium sp.]
MIARFLGIPGIAGIAVSLALTALLLIQRGETGHWRKQSGQFEQLYHSEQSAFAATVANYRAAADAARAADVAAARRVAAEQTAINERTANDFATRIAAVRARAERVQRETALATADPGARGSAPVPGLSAAPGGSAQGAGQGGFPVADQLLATEQAIQLDELIKWVKAQHAVDRQSDGTRAPAPR